MKNVCPKDIYVTADKYQVNTQVSWLENDAWDKRDGRVRYSEVFRIFGLKYMICAFLIYFLYSLYFFFLFKSAHLMEGKPPGRHFSGETKVAYMARDSSGNTATCSFFVFVQGI